MATLLRVCSLSASSIQGSQDQLSTAEDQDGSSREGWVGRGKGEEAGWRLAGQKERGQPQALLQEEQMTEGKWGQGGH